MNHLRLLLSIAVLHTCISICAQDIPNAFAHKQDSCTLLRIISKERLNYTEKDKRTGRAILIVKERESSLLYSYQPASGEFKCTSFQNSISTTRFNQHQILDSSSVSEPVPCERRISTSDYYSLLGLFKNEKDTLSINDFPVDNKWLEKNINKSNILQLANARGAGWQLNGKYATKEEKDRLFNGYANKDSVNLFLKSFPKKQQETKAGRHSFYMIVQFVKGNQMISFRRDHFDFNNPWLEGEDKRPATINPYINQTLLSMLPKEFIGKSKLALDNFKWAYIHWILVKNKYIGS